MKLSHSSTFDTSTSNFLSTPRAKSGEREERRSINKMESEVVGRSKNETMWAYNMVLLSHRMEMGTMTQDTYIHIYKRSQI